MFQTEVAEKLKTHLPCSVTSPPPGRNLGVYDIEWKDIVEGADHR
jgi:hypothetical protein